MLAYIVLVAISLLLCSSQANAQLGDIEAPDVIEFDAVLKSVRQCEGHEDYHYKMMNPKLERISRDTVALSCDLDITMDIPDDPTYTVETLIENASETDESEKIPVATFSWPNICGELANEENESFRTFRESVQGDYLCPIKKGDAGIEDLPDFEATLKSVYTCEGTDYDNHWENCTCERVSPETVLLSMDIVIGKEIPNDPTYMLEIVIENQPNDNAQEKFLVAAITAGDICKELANEENEPVQEFLSKVDGDLHCPIKKGTYKAVGVKMSVEKLKPMLREGIMFFSVTQFIQSEPIACHVAEFIITYE